MHENNKSKNRRFIFNQFLNHREVRIMKNKYVYYTFQLIVLIAAIYVAFLMPETCHASVESSLLGVKSKLTGFILPVLSVCGLIFAAFSFFTGNERAKQHILYAVIGCGIGFGAQAIVDFISQTVN